MILCPFTENLDFRPSVSLNSVSLSEPYDKMGPVYADRSARSPYNAYYDRPAVLALLGDVTGLDVVDAACGPGLYLAELLGRGARLRGFDASGTMLDLARDRVGEAVELKKASLDEPLPYGDASADLIVCALAIHYSSDRAATLREFFRVLRPGGRCVLSTQHPMSDWLRKGGSYFDVVLESDVWGPWSGDQVVHFWREPLSGTSDAATSAGFLIKRIVEPLPEARMAVDHPDDFAQLSTSPGFIIFEFVKL